MKCLRCLSETIQYASFFSSLETACLECGLVLRRRNGVTVAVFENYSPLARLKSKTVTCSQEKNRW